MGWSRPFTSLPTWQKRHFLMEYSQCPLTLHVSSAIDIFFYLRGLTFLQSQTPPQFYPTRFLVRVRKQCEHHPPKGIFFLHFRPVDPTTDITLVQCSFTDSIQTKYLPFSFTIQATWKPVWPVARIHYSETGMYSPQKEQISHVGLGGGPKWPLQSVKFFYMGPHKKPTVDTYASMPVGEKNPFDRNPTWL